MPESTPRVTSVGIDVLNTPALIEVLAGHNAVISPFSGHAQRDIYGYYLDGLRSIISAVKDARVQRLLVVGGAGSLEVAPGVLLVDTPDFPAKWKATAEGARVGLQLLRQEEGLDWTMLSPSAMLEDTGRTENLRLGADSLLVDGQGKSRISIQDYAIAMIDELERPAHSRQRFTVGY
jgi:putative NADH-flavin reductase